jgi:hypothetical protein
MFFESLAQKISTITHNRAKILFRLKSMMRWSRSLRRLRAASCEGIHLMGSIFSFGIGLELYYRMLLPMHRSKCGGISNGGGSQSKQMRGLETACPERANNIHL